MTDLEFLKFDLEYHLKSREEILAGGGAYFVRREGYSVIPLIDSYNRIIESLESEIKALEAKPRKKTKRS
jgi:hypothetical protein